MNRPPGIVRWPARWLLPALLALACHGGEPAGPGYGGSTPSVRFGNPLPGPLLTLEFYGAYIDHNATSGISDYTCGLKTYDGHTGVDILLRNFQVQDSGVVVVAAANGTVQSTHDGEFDRSTTNGAGGFGNNVVIAHGEGVTSIYGHMRRSSIAVTPGQVVTAGTMLGLVGSSGNSNWPHLHFEVQLNNAPRDPFHGSCNALTGLWSSQLAYQDTFLLADAGIVRNDISFAQLLEKPPPVSLITSNDASLTYWLEFFNIQNVSARFNVYDPRDSLYLSQPVNVGRTFSMRFLTLNLPVAGQLSRPGTWRIEYFQNGQRLDTRSFVLALVASASPATPPRARAPRVLLSEQGGDGR